jgi:hypothetical protein
MNPETPAKRLRLEALLAYPPTTNCRKILALLKAIMAEYPDQVRLDIYYAGESPGAMPTRGYQTLDKRKTVPSGYLNGRMILCAELPSLEALRREIDAELQRGPAEWQD